MTEAQIIQILTALLLGGVGVGGGVHLYHRRNGTAGDGCDIRWRTTMLAETKQQGINQERIVRELAEITRNVHSAALVLARLEERIQRESIAP